MIKDFIKEEINSIMTIILIVLLLLLLPFKTNEKSALICYEKEAFENIDFIEEYAKYVKSVNNTYEVSKISLNEDNLLKLQSEKNDIKYQLKIDIKGYKVKLNDKEYIFKTEQDRTCFVNELKTYNKEFQLETIDTQIANITKQEQIDETLKILKEEKEQQKKKELQKQQQILIASRSGNQRTSAHFTVPMQSYNYISSPYGMRKGKMHTGTDFAAAAGTPVYAWKDGVVTIAKWSGGYGNFIEIKHNDNTISRYAHLSGYAIKNGQTVVKGQTIGYVGSTGNSTGPHLHLEIKINNQFVNPVSYLK